MSYHDTLEQAQRDPSPPKADQEDNSFCIAIPESSLLKSLFEGCWLSL